MIELPAADAQHSRAGSLTVGVLADTHIPDRMKELHPQVEHIFRAEGICHILHAGDVCSPRVLATLAEIAPVTAVAGNRDWLLLPDLPIAATVEVGGVQVGLMHGHGGFRRYLHDKFAYLLHGYDLTRYLDLLLNTLPHAQVVVFGHTHHPVQVWQHGKLLFNPGSASVSGHPSVGLLRVDPHGQFTTQIVALSGYRAHRRGWHAVP